MKRISFLGRLMLLVIFGCQPTDSSPRFTVTITLSDALDMTNVDGRLLLMLSNNDQDEPRFQINDGLESQTPTIL